MKKSIVTLTAAALTAMVFTACWFGKPAEIQQAQVAPQVQVTQAQAAPQETFNPYAGATMLPCSDIDTEEYFVGFGTSNGSYKRLDVLNPAALANAQQNVRQKMQHAYKGMITNYINAIGGNQGTDASTNLEAGGNQIIDRVINDTKVHCGPMVTQPDSDGHINIFVGIRIYKQQLAADIANSIANKVSEEEKLKIRFNQQEYEKKMKESFESYKESKEQ